jgi:nuclease-like protein
LGVPVSKTYARPGQFALQRFRTRRHVWRRRIWWVLAIVSAAEVAIVAILAAALQPEHFELYLGIGLGIAITMTMVFFDSPPHHIERWRQGAEGEQATARALRRLVNGGWTPVHDVEIGHGNLDHILVGPPGVFLLETKKLHGAMTVERGVPLGAMA